MRTNFDDVGEFHHRFGLDNVTYGGPYIQPREIPQDLIDFRLKFLREELNEIERGYAEGDLAKVADGLVDLVYVALGTAHLHYFPWEQLWNEVQRANMTKERCLREEDSTRGSRYDVIKPPGWTPPDIIGVLKGYGWTP